MKPPSDPPGARLWAVVAATVRPFPGRCAAKPQASAGDPRAGPRAAAPPARPALHRPLRPPQPIEPGRQHRIVKGALPLAGRLDLHGLTQDRARAALVAFLTAAHAEGRRTVLVITGKGVLGDGVLRRRVPEWLAQAPLRPLVAGLSEAHRRHGGEGALYVALRRRERG